MDNKIIRNCVYEIIYIVGVFIGGMILHWGFHFDVPKPISLTVGWIMCVAGLLILLIFEARKPEQGFFYGDETFWWQGCGFVNSGLILGVSTFFFLYNIIGAFAYLAGICAVSLLLRYVVGKRKLKK